VPIGKLVNCTNVELKSDDDAIEDGTALLLSVQSEHGFV